MAHFLNLLSLFLLFQSFFAENKVDVNYQAALIVDGDRFCAGALISSRHVITKASCVYNAFQIDVILNTCNLLKSVGKAQISTSFKVHQNYTTDGAFLYDVALIKMTEDQNLGILKLRKSGPNDYNLILTGFNLAQLGVQEVREDAQRCRDFSLCHFYQDKFLSVSPVNPEGMEVTNKFRNLGSPLVIRGKYLIGISVQTEDESTLVLKIDPFIDWINEVIREF